MHSSNTTKSEIPRRQFHFESLLLTFPEEAAFSSTQGRAFLTMPLPNDQTFALDDPVVRDWLLHRFFEREGVMPSEPALRDTFRVLQARAHCGKYRAPVALRLGKRFDGSILIDLANHADQAVEISPHGWRLTKSASDLVFRSVRGLLPLPEPAAAPEPDGSVSTFRQLINCPSDSAWSGIQRWLLAALRPTGPYPALILHGPPNSGKTVAARLLRTLLDPNLIPLNALPSRGAAIEKLADVNRVLAFDHVTRMSPSVTDALCRQETPRPIVLTTPRMGIHDWQPRPDLAARAITVHMQQIENPRPPEDLEAEFMKLLPTIQAYLYTAMSKALAEPAGSIEAAPTFTTPDLGLPFASAAADPLFEAIHSYMQTAPAAWTGTATDLFNEICVTLTPRALSQRLRLLAPALAAAGIKVQFQRVHAGLRQITISNESPNENLRHPPPPEPLPTPSPLPENTALSDPPAVVTFSVSTAPSNLSASCVESPRA